MQTLRSIPFLKKTKRTTLKTLVGSAVTLTRPFNSYLFRQGEPITHFYITVRGSFQLTRKISYSKPTGTHIQRKEIFKDPLLH
jgi:CRP-like cAMP-binding protein